MSRGIVLSAVILSALIVTSCATDRINIKRNNDTACKTPESRYDYGKKTMQSVRTKGRNHPASGYIIARNDHHKGSAIKKTPRKNTGPVRSVNETLKASNNSQLSYPALNNEISFSNTPGNLYLDPPDYKLLNFPADQLRVINQEYFNNVQPSYARQVSADQAEIISIKRVNEPGQVNIDNLPLVWSSEKDKMIRASGRPGYPNDMPAKESEYIFLLMALLAGLIPLGIIKANPKLAANISYWAAMNPWKTRLMFALVNTGLIASGLLIGKHLADNSVHFSNLSRDMLFGVFLSSVLLYREKHTSIKLLKHTYLKQKAFDLALSVSGFMLMVTAGNDPDMRVSFTKLTELKGSELQSTVKSVDQSEATGQLVLYKNEDRQQDQTNSYIEEEKLMKRKTGLRILTVLGAIILGVAVAGGACALECNGMTGLAYITGVGGGLLIAALVVAAFKAIRKLQPKKEIKPSEGTDSVPSESVLQT